MKSMFKLKIQYPTSDKKTKREFVVTEDCWVIEETLNGAIEKAQKADSKWVILKSEQHPTPLGKGW